MNVNISTGTVFDRIALLCGVISMCIGGVGLTGWAIGSRILTGMRLDYFPMAPNTALIVILLGGALISGIVWSGNRTIRIAIAGISSLCILIAGLTLIGIVTGINPNIDHLLLNATGMIGTAPVGHMSPVTAICFLLGSVALLLLLFKKNNFISLLGTGIALVSGVVIIGYWYGAPLLYGGNIIPVALTTAVALGALGVGLNAAAGPDSWPLSSVTGVSTRARILRGLLPVILVLVLIVNWINTVIDGHADSSVVLFSAVMGVLSLMVVYVVVSKISHTIGDAIDQSERERKKAEAAQIASEIRYRRLFETAQDGILILDADNGQIVEANPFLINMLGFSHDQFLGKKIWEIGHFSDIGANKENFEELQRKEYIRYEDMPLETADGRRIAVEFVSNVYVVNNKKVIQCNIRDITERKRSQTALQESENRYRTLAESTLDAIIIISQDGRFMYINNQGAATLGKTVEAVRGLLISDVFSPTVAAYMMELINGIFTTGLPIREEILVPSPAGLKSHDAIMIPLKNPDGTVTSILVISRDITDRKRAEVALQQVNKQLNLLSSITRHDILNQLMALKGYLELSHEIIDDPKTLIEYIKKEEQAANTIEHQITFTRDYQELGAAAPAWQNVNANIEKALLGLPMRDIHVEVDPKAPDIFADPLFVKVFYNLIDNALRYGGAGMKTIRVSSQEIDTGLLIVCEDDGVGITAEDKKKLFTRGFGKNTGLGLFLSREILSITVITITETGTPGKGARFEITVPKGMWRMKGASE